MLDIGWSEMAMIALIALIVIGPKDLPRVMRTAGQWTRKARTAARDFQSNLEDMIEDEEIREAKESIETETRRLGKRDSFNIGKSLERHVDPDGSVRKSMREIEQGASDSGADTGAGAAGPGVGAGANGVSPVAAESGGAGAVTADTPVAPGHSVGAAPARDDDASGRAANGGARPDEAGKTVNESDGEGASKGRATAPSDSNV